jgi:hypothetical protein
LMPSEAQVRFDASMPAARATPLYTGMFALRNQKRPRWFDLLKRRQISP